MSQAVNRRSVCQFRYKCLSRIVSFSSCVYFCCAQVSAPNFATGSNVLWLLHRAGRRLMTLLQGETLLKFTLPTLRKLCRQRCFPDMLVWRALRRCCGVAAGGWQRMGWRRVPPEPPNHVLTNAYVYIRVAPYNVGHIPRIMRGGVSWMSWRSTDSGPIRCRVNLRKSRASRKYDLCGKTKALECNVNVSFEKIRG
ncbi:hypothetical protein C8N30_3721 [Sulfitobacter guttiformis]|uniref:Uncharacterized protein n=1 Tax=Sulfitobacter guttiformis TaxID=74349 RepID=A0A420DK68_9RHOB|nr:hypothetical protein C8N30_3721 [Sulfitobacter guttiformis]